MFRSIHERNPPSEFHQDLDRNTGRDNHIGIVNVCCSNRRNNGLGEGAGPLLRAGAKWREIANAQGMGRTHCFSTVLL